MITNANDYFLSGCGRCSLWDTPQCKVHKWQQVLQKLRLLALDCGLTEVAKWGHPVYTYQKSNIVMIGAFSDNAVLSFFKGALLQDSGGILTKPGENTQAARVVRFTDVQEVTKRESILKTYIYEAIEVEKAGLQVALKKTEDYSIPEEFQKKLSERPDLKAAFEALTPGRQRGYLLHFSQAKQSKTRQARVEKYIEQILNGKGLHD